MSVDDSRTLTHADATSIAAEVPNPGSPAPGAGALPLPRNTLEAMSFVAFARQEGVSSFWARSPTPTPSRPRRAASWCCRGSPRAAKPRLPPRRAPVHPAHVGLRPARHRGDARRLPRVRRQARVGDRDHCGRRGAAAAAGGHADALVGPVRNPPPPPSAKRHAYDLFARTEVRRGRGRSAKAGSRASSTASSAWSGKFFGTWQPIFGAGVQAPYCSGCAGTAASAPTTRRATPTATRNAPRRSARGRRAWTSCSPRARRRRTRRSAPTTTARAPSSRRARRARPTRRPCRRSRRAGVAAVAAAVCAALGAVPRL